MSVTPLTRREGEAPGKLGKASHAGGDGLAFPIDPVYILSRAYRSRRAWSGSFHPGRGIPCRFAGTNAAQSVMMR